MSVISMEEVVNHDPPKHRFERRQQLPQRSYNSNWDLAHSHLSTNFSVAALDPADPSPVNRLSRSTSALHLSSAHSVASICAFPEIPEIEPKTFWNDSQSSGSGIPNPKNTSSRCGNCVSYIEQCLPIIAWLRDYSWSRHLPYDVLAGLTVFALQVPQGLAYGKLAGAQPINGLYGAIFPVVVYAIFGGSRHISMGPMMVFGLACAQMIQGVVDPETLPDKGKTHLNSNSKHENDGYGESGTGVTTIQALSVLCLANGIIQALAGVLRLGRMLTALFSDVIMSAFLTAAAVLIVTSEASDLIDIDSSPHPDEPDFFIDSDFIKCWYRFFTRAHTANLVSIIISACCVLSIILTRYGLERWFQRWFKLKTVIIPVDIMLMVVIGFVAWFLDLHKNYSVSLIPRTPAGTLTTLPVIPRFTLVPKLLVGGLQIGFICFANAFLVEKLFAQKYAYKVYPNQELIAMGVANIASSFFLCLPFAGSLSRTTLQDKVGCKTQVTGLVSAILILLLILFLSPLLSQVPLCVLACIVIMALDKMLMKISDLWRYWKESKVDGFVWAATFLIVLIVGMGTGLLYAIGVALATVIIQLLSLISPVDGVLVFKFFSPMIFLNVGQFAEAFDASVIDHLKKRSRRKSGVDRPPKVHTIIIDLSSVPFMHSQGAKCLANVYDQLRGATGIYQIRLLLVQPPRTLFDTFEHSNFFDRFPAENCYFTMEDAIESVRVMETQDKETKRDSQSDSAVGVDKDSLDDELMQSALCAVRFRGVVEEAPHPSGITAKLRLELEDNS